MVLMGHAYHLGWRVRDGVEYVREQLVSKMNLNDHFQRYGYIHLKSVLTASEVEDLRRYLHAYFKTRSNSPSIQSKFSIQQREMLEDQNLWRVILLEPIINGLKEILEQNFTIIPDFNITKNLFRITGAGWHWDSSSEGKQSYLYDPTYRFVKCGVYLQENTAEFGGGVDIAPGFHKFPLTSKNNNLNFKVKTLFDIAGKTLFSKRVRLDPGDFLAFHSCLPHRTTIPQTLLNNQTDEDRSANQIHDIPDEYTKYVFYWDACRSKWSEDFFQNSIRRAYEEELTVADRKQFLFTESVSLRFPEDYPKIFFEAVRSTGVQIKSLELHEARQIKLQLDNATNSRLANNI